MTQQEYNFCIRHKLLYTEYYNGINEIESRKHNFKARIKNIKKKMKKDDQYYCDKYHTDKDDKLSAEYEKQLQEVLFYETQQEGLNNCFSNVPKGAIAKFILNTILPNEDINKPTYFGPNLFSY